MAEYVLFKVSSGEEIIGENVGPDGGTWHIKSPRMLIMQNGPNGIQVGILPYSGGNPDGVHEFYQNSRVSESDKIPVELERLYIENTSNIQIVAG